MKKLQKSADKKWKEIKIGEFEIDISGKVCKVHISINKSGTLEIEPFLDDRDIWAEDGWLSDGHCTEGYNFETNITRHESIRNKNQDLSKF